MSWGGSGSSGFLSVSIEEASFESDVLAFDLDVFAGFDLVEECKVCTVIFDILGKQSASGSRMTT